MSALIKSTAVVIRSDFRLIKFNASAISTCKIAMDVMKYVKLNTTMTYYRFDELNSTTSYSCMKYEIDFQSQILVRNFGEITRKVNYEIHEKPDLGYCIDWYY